MGVKVTVAAEVNIKVTAVKTSLYRSWVSSLAPSQLPSETQGMECHEGKLLSASICSVRQTLPGFIKFLPIPFAFQQPASPVKISLWLC